MRQSSRDFTRQVSVADEEHSFRFLGRGPTFSESPSPSPVVDDLRAVCPGPTLLDHGVGLFRRPFSQTYRVSLEQPKGRPEKQHAGPVTDAVRVLE